MAFLFQLIYNLCHFMSLLLVVYALLSWFPGAYETGLGRFVASIVEPILKPFRKLPLTIAGLDFSVAVAILVLQALPGLILQLL